MCPSTIKREGSDKNCQNHINQRMQGTPCVDGNSEGWREIKQNTCSKDYEGIKEHQHRFTKRNDINYKSMIKRRGSID